MARTKNIPMRKDNDDNSPPKKPSSILPKPKVKNALKLSLKTSQITNDTVENPVGLGMFAKPPDTLPTVPEKKPGNPPISSEKLGVPATPLVTSVKTKDGTILYWKMIPGGSTCKRTAKTRTFEIYCLRSRRFVGAAIPPNEWYLVGTVQRSDMPMICELTDVLEEYRYHIIIRGLDRTNRSGAFSEPIVCNE